MLLSRLGMAGVQIGTMAVAPAGWAPPTQITPVNPSPGTFQSTGAAPAQPGAKVRVSGWGKEHHTQGVQNFA